jgi:cytochrome c oxidase accessory protein FixG
VIPYLSIGGTPVLRFEIGERRFHILGETFLPTDTVLMALLMITIFLSIFFITALFGRVWCGYACPQTVYMEFLYRPIERLIEGAPEKRARVRTAAGPRRILKWALFLLCSLFLAHTFLAYFVAPRDLLTWMTGSPLDHPTAFLVMAVTTGLMMFDFAYFREQVCLVACPYGRLQSAMLDRHSLIVAYDPNRGEPRGRQRRRRVAGDEGDVSLKVVSETGDCIDCKLCVTTCPTGIDIREGLQMECIGCAQCVDACDAVMDKIGKPRGLVRYTSQAILDGKAKHIFRPRILLYPAVVAIAMGLFLFFLTGRQIATAQMLPKRGAAFYTLDSGEIMNRASVRIENRSDGPATYAATVAGPDSVRIDDQRPLTLEPTENGVLEVEVALDPSDFVRGLAEATLTVTSEDGVYEITMPMRLQGPAGGEDPR